MTKPTVAAFPVLKLWRDSSELPIRRLRDVLRDEVDALIAAGPVQLVVAQQGAPLRWLQMDTVKVFWKRTPKSAFYHTISTHGQKPDYSISQSFLLFPSVWEPLDGLPVILLEGIFWPASVIGAAPN